MNILVVDDEKEITDLIQIYLENENFNVYKYYSSQDVLRDIDDLKIDLAILDVMMPDMDGFSLCNTLRRKYKFPIIFVTAKVEDIDKINGLSIGADDYVTKPFQPLELVARVKAQLRRYKNYNEKEEKNEIDFRGIRINSDTREFYFNEKKIDFLIHINHELRTPLTLIYAPLKCLIDKNETQGLPSYLMPQLQLIFNQAQYMREIVDMVLDWNSMEAGYSKLKIQKCKLDEWITNIVKDFTEEARQKGICIKLQITTDIEEVWFDKQKCHTVLSNLLMNALKFSMPESCITINTRKLENKVRISVVDEGIGIQDSDITNLFTRFYKGNHKEKGSGFGLYYAKTIMEMHGGDIGTYNNTDKGATFYLELPLLDINEKAEATKLLQKEAPIVNTTQDLHFDCTGKTILIVEDEKELREYLIESFTETFKKVYAADNAISALETCRKKQPSIIVSDVMMPQMDGFELCRQIKNDIRISHIPVILLTARYDQTGITTGYKSGADSYIPKPFDLAFLKVVVGNILKNREKIHSQDVTVTGSPSLLDLTNSKADEDFRKKINAVIHENLSDEEFSVQQLADAMIVSRSSLYSKIKIITGMGVNDYINRLRIEQAMSLLVNTNLNINEISCEVGFTYPRYFSSTFKSMTGMTPKQFRNEKCNK